MKILYISGYDISASNGPGVNELETIREMIRILDTDAHFIIPRPTRELSLLNENSNLFTFTNEINRNNCFRIISNQIGMVKACRTTLRTFHPDILLFRPIFCPAGQLRCARIANVPYVIKTLGIGVFNPTNEKTGIIGIIVKITKKINESLMKKLVINAKAIDVVTTEYIKYFSEKYPEAKGRFFLLENAVNNEMFQPMDKHECRMRCNIEQYDPIIGFTGGDPYTRGGRIMIESAENLVKHYPNIGIVIVGPSDVRLINMAEKSFAANHIVLTGKKPYEMMPIYINAFDVCVSCDSDDYIEQYGNSSQKVRQYLACGKPVISGGGSDTMFIDRNKLGIVLTTPNSTDCFFDAANRLLSLSNNDYDMIRQRALKYVENNLSIHASFANRMAKWEKCL